MAYAQTSTVTVATISGRRHFRVVLTETEATSASEFSVENLPAVGTITLYQSYIVSGGATIQPKLGKVTSFAAGTNNVICTAAAAVASVHDTTRIPYSSPSNTIFGCSQANASSTVSTVIEIVEGHVL